MISVNFEYDVGEEVIVKPIEAIGYIISLWYTDKGIRYEVRYWSNGDHKQDYLFPCELASRCGGVFTAKEGTGCPP